jgi:hypothetical protein
MLSSWTIYGADIALIAMALFRRAIFTGGGECQFMSDSRKLICGFIIDGKLQKPNLFSLLLGFLKKGLDLHIVMYIKASLFQLSGD